MSQARVSPAMIMAAAAAALARQMPGMFDGSDATVTKRPRHAKSTRARFTKHKHAKIGEGAVAIGQNSGYRKRMRAVRRGATHSPDMSEKRRAKYANAGAGKSGAPARW